jgi:SAM-dependent methyltransferase
MGLLARNRRAFNADTVNTEKRKYFSPSAYLEFAVTVPKALEYAHGDLLDIGAGDVPYRDLFEGKVRVYHTLDHERRTSGIDYIADAQNMRDVVPSDRYDTVVMFHVLEHIPNPFLAAGEIYRVLREGGTLILSAPHFTRLHEQPYDFLRFTEFGLRHIFGGAGFRDIEVIPRGGFFSFLGHQMSTLVVCLTWHIPILGRLAFMLNKWLIVKPCVWLDTVTDKQ